MTTIIKRKLRPSEMMILFDSYQVINIRWYEVMNEKTLITGSDDKVFYNITVRHNEDENVKTIYNNAIKYLKELKQIV